MITDRRKINVIDLGAGSEHQKTGIRNVSEIATHSSVPRKYGKLLSAMALEFGNPLVIELGTSLGISTMYMAACNPGVIIRSIEGSPETAAIARQNFITGGFRNIEVSVGSFDMILPQIISSGEKAGLVFIDGNHRKEPVLNYFNLLAENSCSSTVIIIDDINYSEEMREAWEEIKIHRKVSVSIDIFRMGILFFREGISPSSFVIRY
jgi:predicted O-methyltransferase YrrM